MSEDRALLNLDGPALSDELVQADVERVSASSGTQRLKNVIERGIVGRWIHGERVLDAGIGTGRIGLALDKPGRHVTGVDVSPAMLTQCRIAAGDVALELVEGDIAQLPFQAESFDTVVSIDTLTQPATWMAQVDELLRVTRQGGRVIVDVGSLDHIRAVTARGGSVPAAVNSLGAQLSIEDVAEFAAERGLSVRAIVPYGTLLGKLAGNGWVGTTSAYARERMERLLSWIGTDERLFACAEFIERRIVAESASAFAARMMIVFQRSLPLDAERDVIERLRALEAERRRNDVDLRQIADRHESERAVFIAELTEHFSNRRNCVFACALLDLAGCTFLPPHFIGLFPAPFVEEWNRLERRVNVERSTANFVAAWPAAIGGALTFHGVDIGRALATSMGQEINRTCLRESPNR